MIKEYILLIKFLMDCNGDDNEQQFHNVNSILEDKNDTDKFKILNDMINKEWIVVTGDFYTRYPVPAIYSSIQNRQSNINNTEMEYIAKLTKKGINYYNRYKSLLDNQF